MNQDLVLTLDLDDRKVIAKERLLKADFDKATNAVEKQERKVQELKYWLEGLRNEQAAYAEEHGRTSGSIAEQIDNTKLAIQNETVTLAKLRANAEMAGVKLEEAFASKNNGTSALQDKLKGANKELTRFGRRIKSVVQSALFFTVLTKALTKIRELMGGIVKTNPQFASLAAQIKGNLLIAFQPLYEYALPAIIRIMQVLATATGYVARFTAALFGKSVSDMTANAQALYKQASATNAVTKATKKANQQLAGFDELNVLSSPDKEEQSSGSITPTFTVPTANAENDELFEKTKDWVAIIGGGLVGFKLIKGVIGGISEAIDIASGKTGEWLSETGENGRTHFQNIFAAMMVIAGAALFVYEFIKMWKDGVDWPGFIAILLAVALIVGGIFILFGATGAAIALIVLSVGLIVLAIKDMITNGINLKNGLLLIVGILGIGIALMMLGVGWPALLVAAIVAAVAAIVLVVVKNWDKIKAAFQKGWQAVKDWWHSLPAKFEKMKAKIVAVLAKVWDALKYGAKRAFAFVINIFISYINLIVEAINLVKKGLNKIHFTTPDWVPGVGGKEFGINLPMTAKIPYLATGAVIPPNNPYLAMVGDQRHGTNIETPLETMVEAFRQAQGDNKIVIEFRGNLAQIGRVLEPHISTAKTKRSIW